MPFADVNDARIHYRLDGPPGAPVLTLSNSLGTDFSMWDGQIAALAGKFRVLRYDTRGHGQSSVTNGPYAMDGLGRDVVGLWDALKIDRAHFCGLSMGGMIGMCLAMNAAGRLDRLILCDTAARIGTTEGWNARIEAVHKNGMQSVAAAVVERWFTPEFTARAPAAVGRTRQMLFNTYVDGYAACCGALRDADFREGMAAIRTRTLVITGSRDSVTTPADARFLLERISGARYVELQASHLSNIEAESAFNDAVVQFLCEPEAK
ncbi:MAG: 3-oxoadipate enol-lactonase [Candidatus Acidiferrales bacterium]